jgi:ELWxxDGT repeat protein
LLNVNGTLFFSAGSIHGSELWKTCLTPSGPVARLVKRINPRGCSNPVYLTNVDGTLFFTADDEVHGRGLWKSDGTEAGTVPNDKDFFPDSVPAKPAQSLMNLAVVEGMLFFVAEWRDPAGPQGQGWDPIDLWYLPVPRRRSP